MNSRGLVHLKLGAFDKSILDYDAALRLNPQLAAALYGRGVAKRKAGDGPGADADIAAAQAIRPSIAQELSRSGVE